MSEVSATTAARNFAELLDAVEHRGEKFMIVRRGKVVAQLEPVKLGRGKDVKSFLRHHQPDEHWRRDLDDVRELLVMEERS